MYLELHMHCTSNQEDGANLLCLSDVIHSVECMKAAYNQHNCSKGQRSRLPESAHIRYDAANLKAESVLSA